MHVALDFVHGIALTSGRAILLFAASFKFQACAEIPHPRQMGGVGLGKLR